MGQITEQKCPNCGAAMRFDPASGFLVCDSCGTRVDVEATTPSGTAPNQASTDDFDVAGLSMDQLIAQAADEGAQALPVYNCVSCGAEVIAPPEQVALTCPYCRNNIVLTDKISGKLRPDGVIPFRIRSEELPEAVNKFYSDKKLLPHGFFSHANMGQVTGVYVPFWVFSGHVSGTLLFDASKSRSYRNGSYQITETSYYLLTREAAMDFDGLPVDAGSKMSDRLMDSLEPFHTGEAKTFDMRYLAGFTADRFDQPQSDMAHRARTRMRHSAISATSAAATAGYSSSSPRSQRLQSDLEAKYFLFPVYMFDIEYGRKKYHFAVNGQTGKVVGDLPTSSTAKAWYFLRHGGIVSAVILAAFIITYMMGF